MPTTETPFTAEVRALLKKGDASKAKGMLKSHLKESPSDNDALHLLAGIYRDEKNYSRAKKCLVKILESDPKHEPTRYLQACIDLEEGRFDIATRSLREYVDRNPRDAYAQNSLAFCLNR